MVPQPGKTLIELIEQADQNLYMAKRKGKNQVYGIGEDGQVLSSYVDPLDQTYGV